MNIRRHKNFWAAFTLLELLVVIAIMGLLAALAVPAIKEVGKGQGIQSAARQMLDDVARARQLAISQRTTVYMVFVPMNFWNNNSYTGNASAWSSLTTVEQEKAKTLFDKQSAAYTFITLRSVGDQPGRNTTRYLGQWRYLPDGTFISIDKFFAPNPYTITNPIPTDPGFQITRFATTNIFPFPAEITPAQTPFWLPYIAFNYLGQLESGRDEYIPLARGSISRGGAGGTATATETPAGNSTNTFMIVHVDWITGRARIEQQRMQ